MLLPHPVPSKRLAIKERVRVAWEAAECFISGYQSKPRTTLDVKEALESQELRSDVSGATLSQMLSRRQKIEQSIPQKILLSMNFV